MMKKSKKDKKNYDNVVISNVELTPTTIGEIEENANNIGGVLAIFAFLIVIIVALPYVVNFISGNNEERDYGVIPSTPSGNEEEQPPVEEPTNEVEYLDVSTPISKTINGFKYDINVDVATKKIDLKVTNSSGSALWLVNNPTYIELFTEDKTLLDRILIDKEEIVANATVSFNYTFIDNTNSNQDPVYLTIETKSINDYPAISLSSTDINNLPFLTCTKNNQTLVYTFQNDDTGYFLSKITDRYVVSSSDDSTINTYEALTNSYNSIEGVDADITPRTSGFSFEATIDLSKVSINERKRVLSSKAYYEKDTEAKTIYFELNASGYKCN